MKRKIVKLKGSILMMNMSFRAIAFSCAGVFFAQGYGQSKMISIQRIFNTDTLNCSYTCLDTNKTIVEITLAFMDNHLNRSYKRRIRYSDTFSFQVNKKRELNFDTSEYSIISNKNTIFSLGHDTVLCLRCWIVNSYVADGKMFRSECVSYSASRGFVPYDGIGILFTEVGMPISIEPAINPWAIE